MEQRDDGFTRVKAYKADDNYTEMATGPEGSEASPSGQQKCRICGLTARNMEELRQHLETAHRSEAGTEQQS